jgi:DNA invertase Pin-like site-specific DNA recombinase
MVSSPVTFTLTRTPEAAVTTTRRCAVSYARFSDPKQRKGDSEGRQDRDFRTFCQAHNLTPAGEAYIDRAQSGFRGVHRKKGRLGALIEAAQGGAFEKGTVVVIEAWDRLGRMIPNKQVKLIEELLETGVSIGVCRLGDIFTYEDFGTHKWTTLAVFVQLAYQESKQKSDRVAAAWSRRREQARTDGRALPCQPPAWVEFRSDKPQLIPERAAALKRIFQLAAAGYGLIRIIRQLDAENVPPFTADRSRPGRAVSLLAGRWATSTVHMLLNDRRALGEYQPRDRDGNPAGPPIPDYLPAAITEEDFALAQAAIRGRRIGRDKRGRVLVERQSKHINLFKGLIKHCRDGESMVLHNSKAKDGTPVLLSRSGEEGRGRCYTFPYFVFEEAILELLREVSPADVLPREKETPNAAAVLRAKLADIRGDIGGYKDDLRKRRTPALVALLQEKEAEEEQVATRLQEELAKAARPAERAWEELPSLAELVRDGGDEARLRLRPVLRRVIDSVWVLTVRRGAHTLCAAQAYFAGGDARRDWLVVYRSAGHRRSGGWWRESFREVEGLDLRKPAHVRQLERVLLGADLDRFTLRPLPR